MKIIKQNFNKALDLKLLNNKIYNKDLNVNFNILKFAFKINFKLIFKYHLLNQKIIFFGIPSKINNLIYKILQNTKHLYIPRNLWFNGILTNPTVVFKYLILSKTLDQLIKNLSKFSEINLVVLFNLKLKNLIELLLFKSTTISFNNFLNKFSCFDYCVNLSKGLNFYSLAYFLKVIKNKSQFIIK